MSKKSKRKKRVANLSQEAKQAQHQLRRAAVRKQGKDLWERIMARERALGYDTELKVAPPVDEAFWLFPRGCVVRDVPVLMTAKDIDRLKEIVTKVLTDRPDATAEEIAECCSVNGYRTVDMEMFAGWLRDHYGVI